MPDQEKMDVPGVVDAIRPTGQEPRSEAVEHLVEHLILRKQNQVDFLIRARG